MLINSLHEKAGAWQGMQGELSSAREEIHSLHERIAEREKQLQLKKQKLAVLAE